MYYANAGHLHAINNASAFSILPTMVLRGYQTSVIRRRIKMLELKNIVDETKLPDIAVHFSFICPVTISL